MIASLFLSLAAAVSTYNTGFVTSTASCTAMKAAVCADVACQTLDIGIINAILQLPLLGGQGLFLDALSGTAASTSYGAAFAVGDEVTADTLATFATAVSIAATAQTTTPLTQIHPGLNMVYECEAQAAGLVWADHVGTWTLVQSCLNDAACMDALENIRTTSSSKDEMNPGMNKKAEAVWENGGGLLPVWLPMQKGHIFCDSVMTGNLFCVGHDGNDNDQLCNVVFAAMAEENTLAMGFITAATALMYNDPDEILAHCNATMAKSIGMLLGLTVSGAAVGGILLTAITCCCIKKRGNKEDAI